MKQRKYSADEKLSVVMEMLKVYTEYVCRFMNSEFPRLGSYNRFIQLLPRVIVPLMAFLNSVKGRVSGISFVDSTSLAVCKNKRITRNNVFAGLATRGRTTMGWFFGFKLHLIVNDSGEIISWSINQGNVDDRRAVPILAKRVKGKGYISQPLFKHLFEQGTDYVDSFHHEKQVYAVHGSYSPTKTIHY